jgi:hypothetical protein
MNTSVIEVDVDVDRNPPLDRAIRGRFDWRRVADKHGPDLRDRWGEEPLPGQTLFLDVDKNEGAILDSFHGRKELKQRVESRGETLPPDVQSFTNINPKEWLYWIKSAVKSGKARLLRGQLPDTVDYRPQRFGEVKSTTDRLIETLITMVNAGLTDKQRKEVKDLVGA